MTLDEVQKSTFDQMCACLNQHGQCCVERPTGFGKTKMFMDYVTYNNVNFHPGDHVHYIITPGGRYIIKGRGKVIVTLPKETFKTYFKE